MLKLRQAADAWAPISDRNFIRRIAKVAQVRYSPGESEEPEPVDLGLIGDVRATISA